MPRSSPPSFLLSSPFPPLFYPLPSKPLLPSLSRHYITTFHQPSPITNISPPPPPPPYPPQNHYISTVIIATIPPPSPQRHHHHRRHQSPPSSLSLFLHFFVCWFVCHHHHYRHNHRHAHLPLSCTLSLCVCDSHSVPKSGGLQF